MYRRTLTRTAQMMAILGMSLALASVASAAEAWSAWGSILWLDAGWTADAMAIWHSAPMVNPDKCPTVNAGYATNPADPGHSLFHTIALSALMNKKEVHFLISGCVFSKPHIIAIGVR